MTSRSWDQNHPYYFADEQDLLGENCYADRAYWSRVEGWTIEEGIALSRGYEPRVVNSEILRSIEHPSARIYAEHLSLAARARHMDRLKDYTEPAVFIKWAKSQSMYFDPELEKAVTNRKKAVKATQAREDEHLNAKSRHSLLKLVIGLVVATYRYDHRRPRTSIVREIKDDLDRVGVSLDEDTIRKWLAESTDEFGHLITTGQQDS